MTIPHTDINNNSKNSQNKTVEKVRKTCNVTKKKHQFRLMVIW